MDDDLTPILEQWPYLPGELTVRKIVGTDGRPRVQMRLDLGILQMEVTGRPDGQRPHGKESLLDYHAARVERHRRAHGTDAGFSLTPEECSQLGEESVQYYYRYLSLYQLEEFKQVAEDTARNLRCLDFLHQYAAEESDRNESERYRPYILMMHARAEAALALDQGRFSDAQTVVTRTIARIEAFLREVAPPEALESSPEIESLRHLETEIRRRMPPDPIEAIRRDLQTAIHDEDYERAASLRDKLKRMQSEG